MPIFKQGIIHSVKGGHKYAESCKILTSFFLTKFRQFMGIGKSSCPKKKEGEKKTAFDDDGFFR